jgi:hypothetical protein
LKYQGKRLQNLGVIIINTRCELQIAFGVVPIPGTYVLPSQCDTLRNSLLVVNDNGLRTLGFGDAPGRYGE